MLPICDLRERQRTLKGMLDYYATYPLSPAASMEKAKKELADVEGALATIVAQRAHARTQKAKGIFALEAAGLPVPTPIYLIQTLKNIEALPLTAYPAFARPCPKVPCPGFVDSRLVKGAADLLTVLEQTLQADPKGEVLLMPMIEATWNICLTSGLMSIGPGHDGATAGKASKPFMLCPGTDPAIGAILPRIGLLPDNVVHIEGVLAKGSPSSWAHDGGRSSILRSAIWWTQARSGPEVPSLKDFNPTDVMVSKIEAPIEDLLEWQKMVASFEPGTVVWAPGHTLAAHAALHCIGAGVPFLTTIQPIIGEVLKKVDAPPFSQGDIAEGIGWGLRQQIGGGGADSAYSCLSPGGVEGFRKDLLIVLYGLHHAAALRGSDGFWLGAAAAIMARAGMSCVQGDYSHDLGHKHAGDACNPPNMRSYWNEWILAKDAIHTIPFAAHYAFIPRMTETLFTEGIDQHAMSGGFGGWNWGRCIYSIIGLINAMQDVCSAGRSQARQQTTIGALIVALNNAVDQAHNSNLWMNRYGIDAQDCQAASNNSWQLLMETAPHLYKAQRDQDKDLQSTLAFQALGRLKAPMMECTWTVTGCELAVVYRYTHKRVFTYVIPGAVLAKYPSLTGSQVTCSRRMAKGGVLWLSFDVGKDHIGSQRFDLEVDPRVNFRKLTLARQKATEARLVAAKLK